MKIQEKIFIALAVLYSFVFTLPFNAHAMHIMEGYMGDYFYPVSGGRLLFN